MARVESNDRRSALWSALEASQISGDIEASRALIEADPDLLKERDPDGDHLLHRLCRNGGSGVRRAEEETAEATATAGLASLLAHGWPQALQERDARGLLPLHLAVQRWPSNLELIRALIGARPADAAVERTPDGDRALHLAIKRGAPMAVVRLLVAEGPRDVLRERDAHGSLPLHLAAALSTTLDAVDCITEAWPEALHEVDQEGRLPLHCAAAAGAGNGSETNDRPVRYERNECALVVQYLASRYRPALWVGDRKGWLPLHLACRHGPVVAAGFLAHVGKRALRRPTNTERWLPLHILSQREFSDDPEQRAAEIAAACEIADLWPQGLRVKDANGWLPLHCSAQTAPVEVVRHFAARSPTALRAETDEAKSLPLHLAAAACQDVEVVRCLADAFLLGLQARDATGKLPLHRCVSNIASRLDVVQFLGTAFPGACHERDANGYLPLHLAAATRSVEVVRFLLADLPRGLRERTNDGFLPLHIAAKAGASLEMVQFLTATDPLALQVTSNDGSLPLHLAAASEAQGEDETLTQVIERLAGACPQALDEVDSRGMRAVHAAAIHDAPLDVIYMLARMNPTAVLRLGCSDRLLELPAPTGSSFCHIADHAVPVCCAFGGSRRSMRRWISIHPHWTATDQIEGAPKVLARNVRATTGAKPARRRWKSPQKFPRVLCWVAPSSSP
jgi:ankyrin repeat protein